MYIYTHTYIHTWWKGGGSVTCASSMPRRMSSGSIRQHTPAYVSIRQHTSAYVRNLVEEGRDCDIRLEHAAADELGQHTSAYVSIRQHTSETWWKRGGTVTYASSMPRRMSSGSMTSKAWNTGSHRSTT
jgi:hypothetical protein